MTTVTVSPKFQIVIPAQMREIFSVSPGQKLQIISYQDRIELLPPLKMKKMRGFLKNMNTTIEREDERL